MKSQLGLVSPIICFIASAMFDYKFGVIVALLSLMIGCLIVLIVMLINNKEKAVIRRNTKNKSNFDRRNTNDRRITV